MGCRIKHVPLTCHMESFDPGTIEAQLVDFRDGHWQLKFGSYIGEFQVHMDDVSIDKLFTMLADALHDNAVADAIATADFENESKMDVLNTEAWLDKEG